MNSSENSFIEISNRYEIIEELGQGGIGVVYRAHDSSLDIDVAIKVLRGEADSRNAIRFQKEAKATARMNHDNVVKVLDFGQTAESGLLYLVQEYVSGESLDSLIQDAGVLNLKEAINLFIQICKGVEHAHDCAILHRDLKPSNVLLNYIDNGEVIAKIGDFGLAKILDDDGSATLTTVAGSPLYMSPEQIDGGKVDERSDIYSLGCVFYEMLAGRVPYKGNSLMETFSQHKTGSYPPLINIANEIEDFPEIDRLIERCLQVEPGNRYRKVEELVSELEAIQETLLEKERLLEEEQRAKNAAQESLESNFLQGLILGSTAKKASWAIVIGAIVIGIIASFGLVSTVQNKEERRLSEKLRNVEYVKAESDGEKDKFERRIDMRKDFIDSVKDAPVHFVRKSNMGKEWLYSLAMTITDDDLSVLKNEKDVRNIWIVKSKITGTGFKCLKDRKVLSLNLLKSPISDEGLKTIADISSIDNLRMKYGNQFTDKGLLSLRKLPHLKYLYITSSKVTDDGLIALLPKLTRLEHLSVYGMKQLTDKLVPSILRLKSLQYLNIGDTSISTSIVKKLSRLKKLYYLDVSKLKVKDSDIKDISKLKVNTLVLTDNPLITVKGLSYLKNMKELRTVFLKRCYGVERQSLVDLMSEIPRVKFVLKHETIEINYAHADDMMGPLKRMIEFNIQDDHYQVDK